MKRIVAVSFVVILFISIFGHLISFTIQRYKIRAEVRELIKQEKIKHATQFVFTDEEFSKLDRREGGREFCLNGNMYDVVERKETDGKIVLTAYYDHKETGLLDKLVSFFNEENQPSQTTHRLTAFSLFEFVSPDNEWQYYNSLTCLPLYHSNSEFLSHLSVDLLSPPPDFLFS